jgi:hypothetical protein
LKHHRQEASQTLILVRVVWPAIAMPIIRIHSYAIAAAPRIYKIDLGSRIKMNRGASQVTHCYDMQSTFGKSNKTFLIK